MRPQTYDVSVTRGEEILFRAQEASGPLHVLSSLIHKMRWEVLQIYLLSPSNIVTGPQFLARCRVVLDKTVCVLLLSLAARDGHVIIFWIEAELSHTSVLELSLYPFFFFLSFWSTRRVVYIDMEYRHDGWNSSSHPEPLRTLLIRTTTSQILACQPLEFSMMGVVGLFLKPLFIAKSNPNSCR